MGDGGLNLNGRSVCRIERTPNGRQPKYGAAKKYSRYREVPREVGAERP